LESLSLNIQQPLVLLIYTTTIILIIVTVFLVKLLVDLTSLAKSMQGLAGSVKHELEPTIKELKRALININSVTSSADFQVNNINNRLNKGLDIISTSTKGIFGRARILTSSLKNGISVALQTLVQEKKVK